MIYLISATFTSSYYSGVILSKIRCTLTALQVTDDWTCGFYIRLSAVEATGVLGHITACFGENGVSIRNIIQRDADEDGRVPIVIITHTAGEKAVRKALDSLDESLAQLITLIRVEE